MKKLLSLLLAVNVLMGGFVAFAQQSPQIMTDGGREIILDFPEGQYDGDVFMVPVRRICDIFGASCDWYEEDRKIIINSNDNITRIFLYLDKPTYRIFTFTGIISGEGVDYEVAAPLRIVQDRTLVPLEQLCEALKGSCTWSEDKSRVTINIGAADPQVQIPKLYLGTSSEDVKAGDEVTINIKGDNLQFSEIVGFSGYTLGLIYDKKAFEFVSCNLLDDKGEALETLAMENLDFTEDSIKLARILGIALDCKNNDAVVGKIVLKALTDDGGQVSLSNRIYTIGDDTTLIYAQKDGTALITLKDGRDLQIDTTPVVLK